MSHVALYRRARPLRFADILHQSHIVNTLGNQLASGQVSHAYLFCGTRGTGKTTTARVFARALNCTRREGFEPCGTCPLCTDIVAERCLDVIEIDAASNNGVENIRDLREEVKYPPAQGAYKVYIIDEAHMLTTAAFNALLKTLEEPPAHTVFILATTDPQKIPPTILSRTQRHDFKRIPVSALAEALAAILEKEGIPFEPEALSYIAGVSDGAMRDALSILDQAMSVNNQTVTLTQIQDLLGAVDAAALFDYTAALMAFDASAALSVIAAASADGRDLTRFAGDALNHFRNILIAAHTDNPDLFDCAPERVERFRAQGALVDHETLIGYIYTFSELLNELRYTPHPRLMLEAATIKHCNPRLIDRTDAILARLEKLESTRPGPVVSETPAFAAPPAVETHPEETAAPPPLLPSAPTAAKPPAASPLEPAPSSLDWKGFCDAQKGLLKSMLRLCALREEGGSFEVVCGDVGSQKYLQDHVSEIASCFSSYFQMSAVPNIVFALGNGYNQDDKFREGLQKKIKMPIDFE